MEGLKITYGAEQAKIISGVAILLMFFHHIIGGCGIGWLKDGVSITTTSIMGFTLDGVLGMYGKMCVSLYAFNTGYAMYSNPKSFTYPNILMKAAKFLISYWFICLLFIGYGFIIGANTPTITDIVLNMFGFGAATPNVAHVIFAWYVYFYLTILLISPLLIKIFNKGGGVLDLLFTFSLIAAVYLIHKYICSDFRVIKTIASSLSSYMSSVIIGLLVCKYDLFNVIHGRLGSRNVLIYLLLIAITVVVRNKVFNIGFINSNVDAILSVVLIFSILSILQELKVKQINSALSFLGVYSMNMWFLHAIFFTGTSNVMQKILYFPNLSILVYIWSIILVLPVAMLCSAIQNKIISVLIPSKHKIH